MEKITFSNGAELYKTNIKSLDLIKSTLEDVKKFLNTAMYMPSDNYTYMTDWGSFDYENEMTVKNSIEKIIKFSITKCYELRSENTEPFNKVNVNSWINVVKTGKPKQKEFKKNDVVVLHNHVDLQRYDNSFYPTYTFVYYVQMPDNLENNEGTLIVEGINGERCYFLPNEGDLVIMGGELPHSPNKSPKSTKDRIVIAGNVGFENAKIKVTLI